jgi:hypothetical protein
MPTFNEDVTVNGTVTVIRQGDGAVLLNLSNERHWEFRQRGTGQSTALELASVGGGGNKDLIISTGGQVGIGTTTPEQKLDVAGSIQGTALRAGGPGNDGRLTLLKSNGELIIDLDARFGHMALGGKSQRGRLVINDADGNTVIELSAGSGDIVLGGFGKSGEIFLKDKGGGTTLQLRGDTGDIILENADCAEEFDTVPGSDLGPGTVMVIEPGQRLRPCSSPYDRRVAGVVSGAGARRPGIVLGPRESAADSARVPVALTGTVYCKVDATISAIGVGDLLTSAPRLGHAMRATDAARSFGAVLGKALEGLETDIGTIPILVTLQ